VQKDMKVTGIIEDNSNFKIGIKAHDSISNYEQDTEELSNFN
jgi:hypothetical protein